MAEDVIEDERLDLRLSHDSFCASCASLDPANAETLLLLRNDVYDSIGSWEVTATAADIEETATLGCPTCFIIRETLTRLSDSAIEDKANVRLAIVFCKGDTLRIRATGGDEDDDAYGSFEIYSLGGKLMYSLLQALDALLTKGNRPHGRPSAHVLLSIIRTRAVTFGQEVMLGILRLLRTPTRATA